MEVTGDPPIIVFCRSGKLTPGVGHGSAIDQIRGVRIGKSGRRERRRARASKEGTALTEKSRATLVQSAVGFLRAHGADGSALIGSPGLVRYWDERAQAPFLWNARSRVFIACDDPQSIRAKAAYLRRHRLGGMMFWELSQDPNGELLDVIVASLHQPKVSDTFTGEARRRRWLGEGRAGKQEIPINTAT